MIHTAIIKIEAIDLVDVEFAEGGIENALSIRRERPIVMTPIILNSSPAHPRTVCIHDADLVHRLHFEELAGEDDVTRQLIPAGGGRSS